MKALTPMLLSILVGSLTLLFAQSERGDVGKSPISAKSNAGVPLPGGEQVRGFPPGLAAQLNLSEQQEQQIDRLRDASQTASEAYFEKVKNADQQLRAMIDSENFNESQARQLVGAKSQAMAELEIIHLRTGAAINNVLSAEQKAKLAEIKSNRPEPPQGGDRLGMPPPVNGKPEMPPSPPLF